ncbi:ABC transporter substrate-binding protein [Dryocola sp. BD613]|uniref:ABC transporter substrate-binding protein n=1 Tax=Dryocola sp. BD613 TaxID=3133272 RepID=UPI003F4F8CFA
MKKILTGIIALLFSTLGYAADFPVTIKSCGKSVTFAAPPARAVINDLNMSEMAFALNLQDRIVGLTGISGWYKMTPEFKKQMGAIPELAPKYPALETLLAVKPDFFFAGWNYGMRVGGDVTPQTLSKYGINTFVLSESCVIAGAQKNKATMELLYNDMLTLGKIFGKASLAQNLVDAWKARLKKLPAPAANGKPLKVFVYDSGEDKPFTSGKYAMPTAIIEAAGGTNTMEGLDTSWGTTSWESVAATEPDFIILLDYQTGSGADALRHFLENHPLMKMTPAVKHQRYLKLQYAELTPGPANIAAVEKLAHALYPQAKR